MYYICAILTFTLYSGITPVEHLTLIALPSSKTWLTMTLATELQVRRETEEKKEE